jgi:hypothetical protein
MPTGDGPAQPPRLGIAIAAVIVLNAMFAPGTGAGGPTAPGCTRRQARHREGGSRRSQKKGPPQSW